MVRYRAPNAACVRLPRRWLLLAWRAPHAVSRRSGSTPGIYSHRAANVKRHQGAKLGTRPVVSG